MSILLHLNGAPGVGKSTIAERLVATRSGWQRRSNGNPWTSASQRILRELGGTKAVLMGGGLARELAAVDRAVFVRSERHEVDKAVAEIANLLP